jgi:Rrf2 family protein
MGYGLMAAGYLAEHADEGWIAGSRIPEEFGIPEEFYLKIMQELNKRNIVASKRGPKGGFKLARPASEISLLEVIEASGSSIAHTIDLTQSTADTPLTRNLEKACKGASEKLVSIFRNATLGQMVGK